MRELIQRREFLKFSGIGTVVLMAGVGRQPFGADIPASDDDFYFVQLSDTHIGFGDSKINPDFAGTLRKAVAAVNTLEHEPAFVMFTGDLSHTTEDPKERRARLKEFKSIVDQLTVKKVHFMPGEHDAALDKGAAFSEFFGPTRYSFEHRGVHFIVIDNVSDPASLIGEAQLQWLAGELQKRNKTDRIVVFTHRPIFSLYPQWDWWTRDGQQAIDLLMPFENVVVFYGHIHQENYFMTGHIPHHAAKGMMFPLPAPGSQPKRAPLPWDPAMPYKGLGFREVEVKPAMVGMAPMAAGYTIVEYPMVKIVDPAAKVIKITAKKFAYDPNVITLKMGEPVMLEFSSLDVTHGFNCPDLGIRCDINPGKVSQVSFTPQTTGEFPFLCDHFCGEGHDSMNGKIIVVK